MIKAVIFDMDGVIVDTEPLHHKAYFQMFDQFGLKLTEKEYRSYTGQSTINVCKNLVENYGLSNSPEELKTVKQDNFKRIFREDDDLQLIEGVLDLIKDYHSNGLKLVLASSASHNTINNVFDRFDLNQYFIGKLSGADFKESKPHPEIFIKAAEITGFSREECIVIEDSTNGIEAANRAEIYCIGFKSPHSKNQIYDNAEWIIDDFEEIGFKQLQSRFALA